MFHFHFNVQKLRKECQKMKNKFLHLRLMFIKILSNYHTQMKR